MDRWNYAITGPIMDGESYNDTITVYPYRDPNDPRNIEIPEGGLDD